MRRGDTLGTALERAEDYEARRPISAVAARFDDLVPTLIQRQPDDPQCQLALARNLAERGKRRLAEKQPAKAQAELEKAREVFTRLLSPGDHWTVLTPLEMKSETGAKMELQKDGSIFVHQIQPAKNDSYSLVFPYELKGITGLRLKVLTDSRLPLGGSGWGAEEGDFVLSELTLHVAPSENPSQARSIALRNASGLRTAPPKQGSLPRPRPWKACWKNWRSERRAMGRSRPSWPAILPNKVMRRWPTQPAPKPWCGSMRSWRRNPRAQHWPR
jgi:hypothetical protein